MPNETGQASDNTGPKDKEVREYFDKGVEAIKRQNYDYAVELFKTALALKQDLAEARYYLWLAMWEKQKTITDPLKIRFIINRLSSLVPSLQGYSLKRKGKSWEAVYQFEKAINSDPSNTFALNAMADCFLSEDQVLNAIKILEAIPQVDAKNYKALKKLGQLYMKVENYAKARAYFNAALAVNPTDADTEGFIKDLDAIKTMKGSFTEPI